MSVREYIDALREFHRIERVVRTMKDELGGQIAELRQDIHEAEKELDDDSKKVQALNKKLKAPFATQVDSDLVFRLEGQPIQIIPITEE